MFKLQELILRMDPDSELAPNPAFDMAAPYWHGRTDTKTDTALVGFS
jgi:hypothetical protein